MDNWTSVSPDEEAVFRAAIQAREPIFPSLDVKFVVAFHYTKYSTKSKDSFSHVTQQSRNVAYVTVSKISLRIVCRDPNIEQGG